MGSGPTRKGMVSPNQTINAVSEDVAGNIWVGTDAGGVSKLTMNGFVSFRQEGRAPAQYT